MSCEESDKRHASTGDTARLKKLELVEEEPEDVLKQRGRDPYNIPARQPRRWQRRHENVGEDTVYFVGEPLGKSPPDDESS